MSRIKMVTFCTLMIVISLCDGVEVTKRENMEFRFEEECRYLSNENRNPRPNAFYIPEKGFFCCMCPEGHSYTGNCDDGRPQNTHCEICSDGTDITHEPHVEEVCQPITCSGGKVYDSSLKKCRCPPGKVETRNGKFCKKKRTQPKQKQVDVVSTSEQTTNGKISIMKTPTGRADVNPMTHPGSLVISSPGQITDGKTLTEKPSTETPIVATSTIFARLISNHSSMNSPVKSSTAVNGLSNTTPTEDTGQMNYDKRDKSSTSASTTASDFSETKLPATLGNWIMPVSIAVPVAILIIIIIIAVGIPIYRHKESAGDVELTTSSCLPKFKRNDENDRKLALDESSETLLSVKENTPQLGRNANPAAEHGHISASPLTQNQDCTCPTSANIPDDLIEEFASIITLSDLAEVGRRLLRCPRDFDDIYYSSLISERKEKARKIIWKAQERNPSLNVEDLSEAVSGFGYLENVVNKYRTADSI